MRQLRRLAEESGDQPIGPAKFFPSSMIQLALVMQNEPDGVEPLTSDEHDEFTKLLAQKHKKDN